MADKKRGPGAPRKFKETDRLVVKVEASYKAKLQAAAQEKGKTLSDFVLDLLYKAVRLS